MEGPFWTMHLRQPVSTDPRSCQMHNHDEVKHLNDLLLHTPLIPVPSFLQGSTG